MNIKTGIVLFALFLVIFIGVGLVLFYDDIFGTSFSGSTTLVNNIQKDDSITLDIYDSTAWYKYNKETALPINIFGVYVSPVFVLQPGEQVMITISSKTPITTYPSSNGLMVEVLNTGSNIINWDAIQHANASNEVYNVYENSRVMILTIENIEAYTSYYCLKLRNYSSSSTSCMYTISNTGNKVPIVTTITSTALYTINTNATITTTMVGTDSTTITRSDVLPVPEFFITVPAGITTTDGTAITHTHSIIYVTTSTVTVTVIVPEISN